MSLNKQLVHLNMTGGLQKKDDQFLVIPSKLAVADNVEFDDASTVINRGGQSSVSLTHVSPSVLQVRRGERLFTNNNRLFVESRGDALGVGTGGGVHRVNASGGTAIIGNYSTVAGFLAPFRFRRAGAETSRVFGVNYKYQGQGTGTPLYNGSYDIGMSSTHTFFACEMRASSSTISTIKVRIVETATGYTSYEGFIEDGTNILVKPRIVTNTSGASYLYFGSFAAATASFSIKVVPLTAVAGGVTSVFTSSATGGNIESTSVDSVIFDAAYNAAGTRVGLVVRDATAAGTTILFKNVDAADGYTILHSSSGTASARVTHITALYTNDGSNSRIHGFYGVGTAAAKGMNFIPAGATSAENTIGTAPAGAVYRISAYENSTTQIVLAFDALTTTGSLLRSDTRLSSFTHVYGSLTECAATGPWFIAGRIASVQSRLYMPMVYLSAYYQGTLFMVDVSDALLNLGVGGNTGSPWQVLARIDYGEVAIPPATLLSWNRVPSTPVSGDTLRTMYPKYETDLRLAGTSNDTPVSMHQVVVDLQSQLQHEEVNGLTFLAGACPYLFDGSSIVEENFHHGPELDPSAALTTTGYQLPNVSASYTVCFTVAWQDAQGNWHESAPSNERTFAVTSGSGNYYIPTSAVILPPTQKANYLVLMYRTPALGTNTSLYLASKVDGTFVTSDTDLDDGEQLYTAGNVLPNAPAPACRHVSVFQKRLVLAGCGDGSRIYWSKQTTPGYGVEFNSGDPTHQTQVPSDKGRAVATKEMDDRLVILCENGVGIIGGQGPDPTGTQGQYSDFSSIITETGCSWDSPKSVIRGPEGVWFRSPFGLRLVSRSGSLARAQDGKQVGAEVDSLVSGTVIAIAGDARQQLRFYQSSGTALVWDYQWQQWSRFTQMNNVDACYADDRYYTLANYNTSSPVLRYTDPSVFQDWVISGVSLVQATVPGYIETSWLSFAGIQGFQRLYRLMILMKAAAGTAFVESSLSLGFDFDVTSPPTGETATSSYAPTASGVAQLQHHMAKQKCEAMKIGLSFYSTTSRVRVTDLTLQVGVKGGYFKVPSSQRF